VHASTPHLSLSLSPSLAHILKLCKSAWSLGMTVQATKRERERPYLLRSLSRKVTQLCSSVLLFFCFSFRKLLRTSNRWLDSLTKQVGVFCSRIIPRLRQTTILTDRQKDRQTEGSIRLRAFLSFSPFSVESSSNFSKVETKSDKQGRMMLGKFVLMIDW
jgi:hypothetical protein